MAIPTKIGNYEVLRQIGSGGMGSVYLGLDPELDRQVAIKVVREEVHDQEVLDRFFREARAAAALRHPNIITIYASGQHEHQPYMAMEFVEGDSLAEIIKQRRNVPFSDKMSYLEQLCSGLNFAHKAGIVHRDIKPANIMVDREGVVRILDFGIARIEGSAMTQDGAMLGSLNYMSPEQMLGRAVDLRSDVFSVGSVAYELISYKQAFKGGLNDGLLHRLPHEHPPALREIYPGVPPAIEQIIMRALEKAPDKRFQSLADMGSAIAEAQAAPQTEEGGTILIARAGASRPAVPAAGMPPAQAATAPPPVTAAKAVGEADRLGKASAQKAGVQEAPPPPAPAGIRLQRDVAAAAKASPTVPNVSSTVTNADPTVTTSAYATPKRAPAVPAPRSATQTAARKWFLVGSAAALILAAAAAIPWLTAAPPNILNQERPGIEAAMGRYRIAYRNRDLEGIAAVFPTLPAATRQAMQRSFTNCLVYEMTFEGMEVTLNPADPTRAQADVRSTHICTPNAGRQTTTGQRDVFTLRKNGEAWLIDSAVRAPNASAGGTR